MAPISSYVLCCVEYRFITASYDWAYKVIVPMWRSFNWLFPTQLIVEFALYTVWGIVRLRSNRNVFGPVPARAMSFAQLADADLSAIGVCRGRGPLSKFPEKISIDFFASKTPSETILFLRSAEVGATRIDSDHAECCLSWYLASLLLTTRLVYFCCSPGYWLAS